MPAKRNLSDDQIIIARLRASGYLMMAGPSRATDDLDTTRKIGVHRQPTGRRTRSARKAATAF
jgi:hypothetical protein